MDQHRGRDEEHEARGPEPIPSFELPREAPSKRWERRRLEEELEEKTALGWDTPISRHEFLRLARKLGLSLAGASALYPAFLAACGQTAASRGGQAGFDVGGGGGGGETINIGVISIYSGVGAFVGKLVDHGADLAKEQINKHGLPIASSYTNEGFPNFDSYLAQTTGGILGGRKINLIKRDDNLSAQVAVSAIQEMITRFDIKGLIFAGLYDDIYAAKKLLQQFNVPAIAAYGDLFSVGQLWPKTDYRQLFQMFPPDLWGIELALEEYAIRDRGYRRFAFLGDNTAIGSQGKRLIGEILGRQGIDLLASEQFNVGDVDMTAQLTRIRGTRCQALLLWGIAGDTAHGLENLKRLNAVYKDHPTAQRASPWAPQIIGFEGGAAERTFAVLAGDAARSGTISYWYLGGVGYIPQFQGGVDIFKKRWGQAPTGGENNPLDAVFLFATAFEQAKGTDPNKVVAALENLQPIVTGVKGVNFASIAPHSFSADRHISIEKDDMVGVTLERGRAVPTDPPYELGTEFKAFHPPGYIGPTHFVRFNLEGLLRKHRKVFGEIMLKDGYGTQCTKRKDPSAPYGFRLTGECKIH